MPVPEPPPSELSENIDVDAALDGGSSSRSSVGDIGAPLLVCVASDIVASVSTEGRAWPSDCDCDCDCDAVRDRSEDTDTRSDSFELVDTIAERL